VLVGPGDDAAAVRPTRRPLLLTTDSLIESVHFRHGWTSPADLGRRAFAVNASDIAAMGGAPRYALVALEIPGRAPVAEIDALVAGFSTAARRSGARLIGGNLARGPHLAITVTLIGEAPGRVVTRSGARPGDHLFVTGALGATGLAVRRLAAGRRGRLPALPNRVSQGILLARLAHAMIDVSDGLAQDLGHVCRASSVAAEIELARLPVATACRRALGERAEVFAATAGEDYELLVAIPPHQLPALARLRLGCRLTEIGRVARGRPAVRLLDRAGLPVRVPRGGFDHFARA
jgi:thiamine-monophosphate kinase